MNADISVGEIITTLANYAQTLQNIRRDMEREPAPISEGHYKTYCHQIGGVEAGLREYTTSITHRVINAARVKV